MLIGHAAIGFAFIPCFILTWLLATRILKPLKWWRKVLPERRKQTFAKLWLPTMIIGFSFLFVGISIWLLFTPPGTIHEITRAQYTYWTSLVLSVFLIILAVIFGFAKDIIQQDRRMPWI